MIEMKWLALLIVMICCLAPSPAEAKLFKRFRCRGNSCSYSYYYYTYSGAAQNDKRVQQRVLPTAERFQRSTNRRSYAQR